MSDAGNGPIRILEERLRLGFGFSAAHRQHVLGLLSSLERHLARWQPEQVDVEISVKDRNGPEQRVTFEARLPKWPPLVATSTARDLDQALIEVRKEMIRQIEDEKAKRGGHEHLGSSGRTA
jgi:ribosome-associated translation inhibitor RaiA